MIRTLLRRTAYLLLGIIGIAAGVYLGDTATFYLRGKPQAQVTTTSLLAATMKGNKVQYYYEGTQLTACALALFPQASMTPCWYLRRHPDLIDNP